MADSEIVARLRGSGSVFAEEEARVLITSARSIEDLEAMVRRRETGEPIEVIVGWADFCGQRIIVEPGVFVPRTRTGILVHEGAALIGPGAVVVDLCCGTGAVGLALSTRVGGIDLYASDIDPVAVRCACRNVEPIGGQVFEGDLFDALPAMLRGQIGLLVVNAPYVPTDAIAMMPPEARVHEPRIALDGGADGVDVHRSVARQAAEWLAPSGHVLIETSWPQVILTAEAVRAAGFEVRVVASDESGGTVVIGTR